MRNNVHFFHITWLIDFLKDHLRTLKNMVEETSVVTHGRPNRRGCHMCSFNPWVKLIRSLPLGVSEK